MAICTVTVQSTNVTATTSVVVEQNQGGQLFRYLHAERALPAWARSLARPGPLPLRPGEIVHACREGN
jgi:2-oxoglutarate ferredoxin oxidoreductase subunit alpha